MLANDFRISPAKVWTHLAKKFRWLTQKATSDRTLISDKIDNQIVSVYMYFYSVYSMLCEMFINPRSHQENYVFVPTSKGTKCQGQVSWLAQQFGAHAVNVRFDPIVHYRMLKGTMVLFAIKRRIIQK